ncbi:MAG: hypothetical protein HQK79_19880 [Desulfobacterales bacterium]|nr:hypothetical protein [Desulfobacterales bacterium]
MITFKIHLKMTALEDLHIGNGISHLGEYDSGHAVDSKGVPCVPHSTLMGMIREGCRKVMQEINKTEYKEYFEELFKFSKGESLLLEPLSLKAPDDILKNPFIVHPSTAVKLCGTAVPHSLRSIQCVRRGAIFEGDIYGNVTKEEVFKYLKDGIRRIRYIGGDRNRGLGKIFFEIIETKIRLSHLQEADKQFISSEDKPSFLMLRFKLKDIVTIGNQAAANNIQFTRDYIRSENILGAWRHVLRTYILPQMSCFKESFKIIDDYNDSPIFSNLYPLPEIDNLAEQFKKMSPFSIIPFPISLTLPKSSDLKHLSRPSDLNEFPCWFSPYSSNSKDLKKMHARDRLSSKQDSVEKSEVILKYKTGDGFLWHKEKDDFEIVKNPLIRNLRNKVEENFGNVKDDSLFVEESLCEGTNFLGWIYFYNDRQRKMFEDLFRCWLPKEFLPSCLPLGIGRGRKAIFIEQKVVHSGSSYFKDNLLTVQTQQPSQDTQLNLLFLSDAIFLDETGQSISSLTPEALKDYLQIKDNNSYIRIIQRYENSYFYASMHSNGGFFTPAWNLIEKGSAYKIEFKNPGNNPVYKALLERFNKGIGIGENLKNGYGMFALNHPINEMWNPKPEHSTGREKYLPPIPNVDSEREKHQRTAENFYEKCLINLGCSKSKLSSFLTFVENNSKEKVKEAIEQLKRIDKSTEVFWKNSIKELERHFNQYDKEQLAVSIRFWLFKNKDKK